MELRENICVNYMEKQHAAAVELETEIIKIKKKYIKFGVMLGIHCELFSEQLRFSVLFTKLPLLNRAMSFILTILLCH